MEEHSASGDASGSPVGNESSNVPTGQSGQELENSGISSGTTKEEIPASLSHIGFTLAGTAFGFFEVLFIVMFGSKFWFGIDIHWLGIPAVIVATVIAHLFLKFQESQAGCHLFSPIWKEKPPIVYSHWITCDDPSFIPGIRFGNKRIAWEAIDELELTFLGNLLIKSYRLKGKPNIEPKSRLERRILKPDVVLKLPFGVAATEKQCELVRKIQAKQPHVVLNKRLSGKLDYKEIKGANFVQVSGAVFMFLVLMDVGFSTFTHLEMLKGFYQARIDARDHQIEKAKQEYAGAAQIMDHPFPLSWVSTKLLTQEPVGPALFQARANALWELGKRDEAIATLDKALRLSKKSYRINLQMARMLTETGRFSEAEQQLEKAMDNHKNSFLPELYMVALRQRVAPDTVNPKAQETYHQYKSDLDDDLFKHEPNWPPGGDRYLADTWYKADLEFVFDRLIGKKH